MKGGRPQRATGACVGQGGMPVGSGTWDWIQLLWRGDRLLTLAGDKPRVKSPPRNVALFRGGFIVDSGTEGPAPPRFGGAGSLGKLMNGLTVSRR